MSETKAVKIEGKEYQIPSSWTVKRFGDIFHRRSETTNSVDVENNRYVGLENIEKREPKSVSFINKADERSSNRVFRSGDVLFGKLAPDLEKAAIVKFDGICSSDIIPMYASDASSEEYLSYLLHTEFFLKRAISTMEGTNLPRTRWKDIADLSVPLPTKEEQEAIVSTLNSVSDLIHVEEEIIEELSRAKDGLAQTVFTTGVGNNELIEVQVGPREIHIPKHWELKEVQEVLDSSVNRPIRGGPPGSRVKKEDRSNTGPRIYTQENVIKRDYSFGSEQITEEKFEELKTAEIKPGDILITRAGTVGEADIFPQHAKKGILDSNLIRVRVDSSSCLPEYLSAFISNSGIAQFQIVSMTHGGTRANLNNGIIESIVVPVPPIEEQEQITSVLNICKQLSEVGEDTIRIRKDVRQTLIQRYLTGEERVSTDYE
ncbi:type I restriction enzyme, S subunit [Halalkaliarchaeum desulfuricum]|uniref:Type I restriction enzyme, S subunit n=1 Tax=Halalkaliarchaeum desulfuricum TaxID=2055893 RepID=A0A343TLV3_9EURY|nr:restriction endonuclease subunit S [Halalkaliarchaeum desulfuricum]AUX10075.1 type I restriction enzyme, S subunit [Halalkaliarchaeum desulfuricum]